MNCVARVNILGAVEMARSIRSLQQLCQALRSIPRTSNNTLRTLHSKRCSSTVILGQSTVLLQDGLQIQELPWVIRRLDPREFPFTRATYAADDIRKHAEQDDAFEQLLQECKNVPQVFRLLEVPGEQVTAYSAAFALRRISQLRESTSDDIDSFIRKAILNELCETVIRDIKHLTNDALIDVVKYSVSSRCYDDKFVEKVKEEAETRIGDGIFTIPELCSLISTLSEHIRGDLNTTRNVWIHLGSRYKEINEENIALVYGTMRNVTPEFRYLWSILDRQLQSCWWKLIASDISTIAQQLVLGNCQSSQTLSAFGKWLFTNVHQVKDSEIKDILALYTHFNFSDANIVNALERYVNAKVGVMDKTLIAMLMDYCCQKRFLSTCIFDAAAKDFQASAAVYKPIEVTFTLRAFGILNYLPPNSAEFFATVENVLASSFAEIDPALLLELLTSFVFLERFPVNFISSVFAPHFIAKVRAIPDVTRRQKALRNLLQLQASVLLEFPSKKLIQTIDRDSVKFSLTWLEGRSYKFHQEVGVILKDLLGMDYFREMFIPRYTPHVINFEVSVDENKNAVKTFGEDKDLASKLALVGVMPEHYCINTHHLLGEFATKKRHLQRLRYVVIEMDYEVFMWKCRGTTAKMKYLKSLLSPHINFLSKSN